MATITLIYKNKRTKKRFLSKTLNNGYEAMFLQFSALEGLKCYFTKAEATSARKKQRKAHAKRIGPKVLSPVVKFEFPSCKIEFESRNKKMTKGYAYKTQVAKAIRSFNQISNSRQYDALIEKAEEVDIGTGDLCTDNLGRIGTRIVMIDFGDVSS